MKTRPLLPCILFAASLLASSPALASDIDTREHIEVVGSAEVKVVPDEFVVRATLRSFDAKLDRAASANDDSVRKTVGAMKRLGVVRRYVVTDQIQVNAVTEGYRERGNFRRIGYSVSREVMVVLHDAKKVEPVMKALFAQGVDRLDLQTHHTKMAEHVAAAEVAAATAARKKAKALSGALGRKLGRALAMTESSPQGRSTSNFVYSAATPDLGDALTLGKLKVSASVRVKFLLDP